MKSEFCPPSQLLFWQEFRNSKLHIQSKKFWAGSLSAKQSAFNSNITMQPKSLSTSKTAQPMCLTTARYAAGLRRRWRWILLERIRNQFGASWRLGPVQLLTFALAVRFILLIIVDLVCRRRRSRCTWARWRRRLWRWFENLLPSILQKQCVVWLITQQ